MSTWWDGAFCRAALMTLSIAAPARADDSGAGPAITVGYGTEYARVGGQAVWNHRLGPVLVGPWAGAGWLPDRDDGRGIGWMAGARVALPLLERHRIVLGLGGGRLGMRTLVLHEARVATRPLHGVIAALGYELVSIEGFVARIMPGLALRTDAPAPEGVGPALVISAGVGWQLW